MLKGKNGITLISLVITIAVLIILAGISFRWLVGDNSLIKQSVDSKEAYEETEAKGEVDEAFIQAETKKSINNTIDVPTEMQNILRKEDDTAIVTGSEDGTLTTHYKGYLFVIQGSKVVAITKDSIPAENTKEISQTKDKNPGDITTDADGNKLVGSRDIPYEVNSIEDLIAVADNVEYGNTFEDKFIKLNNSLDFNSDMSYVNASATTLKTYGLDGTTEIKTHTYNETLKKSMTEEEGFEGIGWYNEELDEWNYFSGVFDGNEKEIQNLHIDKGFAATGLFNCNIGIIKKLGVTGNIKLYDDDNEYNMHPNIGGVAGYNEGIIINCYSKVNVNVFHLSDEYIEFMYIGGIVGYNVYGKIYNSYSSGMLTGDSENRIEGSVYIGGIAGYSSFSEITNCYNSSDMYINGCYYTYVGGIVGEAYNENTIKYCYNIGDININNIISGGGAGGIIGNAYYSKGEISNCYNLGSIIDEYKTARGVICGGIVGEIYYWGEVDLSIYSNNYCKIGIGGICGEDIYGYADQIDLTLAEVVNYIRNKDYPYIEADELAISDLLEPGVYVKYDTSSLTESYTTNVAETGYVVETEQEDGTVVETEVEQTFTPSNYTGDWIVLSNEDGKVEIIPEDSILDDSGVGLSLTGVNGYKNCVKVLQDICLLYLNEDLAESIRSLGYDENTSVEVLENFPETGENITYDNNYADTGNLFKDWIKILKNNIIISVGYDMLGASRHYTGDFNMRGILWSSYQEVMDWYYSSLAYWSSYYGEWKYYTLTGSICPVIELKNSLQVTGGSGTQEDPYILE